MSGFDDVSPPVPSDPAAASAPASGADLEVQVDGEVEVDLAAFLPEGVSVAAYGAAEVDEVDEVAEGEGAGELASAPRGSSGVDLDALRQIELDLDAVDAAIAALDAGTYGIDPETGERIDDALLAADPTRVS
ncbi:MAG: hypothetical protein R2701_02765 [Acidimicrobiales bacterium]